MTEAEKKRRAVEADRLMDEPLLVEAFAGIEASALDELLAVRGFDQADDDKRRGLVDRINTIRAVRRHLAVTIATGVAAATASDRFD